MPPLDNFPEEDWSGWIKVFIVVISAASILGALLESCTTSKSSSTESKNSRGLAE